MRTNSTIRNSYNTTDKVYLGSFNLKRPLLLPFLLSLIVLICGNLLFLNHYGTTLFTLSISAASFFLLAVSAMFFRSLIAEAYLKQDNFVVKYLRNKQAKVMCVKCVRNIRTYKMFGFHVSVITYKLDGVKQKAMVFGSNTNDPKELILQAKTAAAA